jgi:hypothetical protein
MYTPPDGWVEKTGATIAFKAPCGCTEATAIQIGGNTHSFVDSNGDVLTGTRFKKGELVEAILNVEELQAYICTETANTDFMAGLLNALHPVGSLYWSKNPTDPADLFGGTWERIKDKFILAAGDDYEAGTEGGEASVVLKTEELPPHSHYGVWFGDYELTYANQASTGAGYSAGVGVNGDTHFTTGRAGGNEPHNNMPPYVAFYCWERTA